MRPTDPFTVMGWAVGGQNTDICASQPKSARAYIPIKKKCFGLKIRNTFALEKVDLNK